MAIADDSRTIGTGTETGPPRVKEVMAGLLLVVLVASHFTRGALPADALAPVIVTLLFAVSALTAGLALLCRRDRFRTLGFDLAGGLTFIGIVLSVMIEPDQMIRLFAPTEQAE